ncbi:hypothetical protein H0X06_07130 [Candidatus Dependentiae bacterium]|nr:hypothetical protein [Candidatus Dependentiae bacterium]
MFKKLMLSSLMLLAGLCANVSTQCAKLCPLAGVRGTLCTIPRQAPYIGSGDFTVPFEVRYGKGIVLPNPNVIIKITDITAAYKAASLINPASTWVAREVSLPLELQWIKPFCIVPTVQYTGQNNTGGTLVLAGGAAIVLNGFFVNQGDATKTGATSSTIVTFLAANDTVANAVQTSLINNFCLHAGAFAEKIK